MVTGSLLIMDGYIYYHSSHFVYFSFIDIHGHFSFTNYEQVFSTRYLKCLLIQFGMPQFGKLQ